MKRNLTFAAVAITCLALIAVFASSSQTAQGFPSKQQDCTNCHGTQGSYPNAVTASPSSNTVAPGASYQVNITMSPPVNGASGTGYWIANSDASGTTGSNTGIYGGGSGQGALGSWTANMTAPTAPGTYYYKVFGQSGPWGSNGFPGFALYSITVAGVATATPTDTTVPPTVTPTSTTVPPTSTSVPPSPTGTTVPPTSTNTPVPPPPTSTSVPPTATTVPPTGTPKSGGVLYKRYCAACHEPSSPSYVHENIYGESAEDIKEALDEESAMTSLKGVLSSRDIFDIAVYLKTMSSDRDKDGDDHEIRDRSKEKRSEKD